MVLRKQKKSRVFFASLLFGCSTFPIASAANPIILPVGDSITKGFAAQLSYREEFESRMNASGCAVVMRGSETTGHPTPHEGYSGHRVDHFINGLANNPGIQTTMSIYSPPGDAADAVLLHLGTNDMLNAQSVSSTLTELQQVIDIIHTNVSTPVFIANVVPWYDTDTDGDGILDGTNAQADALSAGIEANYSNYSGAGDVFLVDVRTGFRPTDMVIDGIHPSPDDASDPRSDSGEHRLAVAFAAALEAEGVCVPSLSDASFPLTDILTPAPGDTISGSLTIIGKATDTGEDDIDRVRLAIRDASNQWWNFSLGSFGGFNSIDAHITQSSANYADWRAGFVGDPGPSGIDINLPPGDFTLFALAIDDSGNQNYFNAGLWPEQTEFSVVSVGTCNGLPVTVNLALGDVPTSGDDVILGTSGADVILGMGGNDTICGLAGNDDINGGRDEDWIDAGPGDDIVLGGNDADEIYGDSGDDDLFGGPGNDVIAGEAGDDFLKGNSGNDDLSGNEGVDKISGGPGNDIIDTGTGSNVGTAQTVTGGNGNDTIYGGANADELRGEAGEDTIRGRDGNDRLFGGGGEDDVNGEEGDDLVRGNAADDILRGGSGNDTVDGLGGKDLMYGGDGADVMSGSTGNDTMYGQTGDDTLNGGGGNDSLNGDGGIDDCDGAGGTGDTATSCETQTNIP